MDNKLKHTKQIGFSVSNDYFKTLEDEILNKISSTPKDPGFVVDHSFFDTLDSKVMQAIEDETKVQKLFPWKDLAYASGIAASLIIAINALFSNNDTVSFGAIETASLETYIETDIEFDELSSYLEEEDITLNGFSDIELSESSLENYILNDTDLDDLIIE